MVKIQYCLFQSVLNLFRKTHDVKRRDLRLFNIIFSKANGQLRGKPGSTNNRLLESTNERERWGGGGGGLRKIIVLMFPWVIFWSDTSSIVFFTNIGKSRTRRTPKELTSARLKDIQVTHCSHCIRECIPIYLRLIGEQLEINVEERD